MSTYRGIGKNKSKVSGIYKIVIPHAPVERRFANAADKGLEKWREMLDQEYPLMTPEEISRAEQPFHMNLLHDMINQGDSAAAQEVLNLIKKEDHERAFQQMEYKSKVKKNLIELPNKLQKLAGALALCHIYQQQENYEAELNLRKGLAEDAMHDGDVWLSKHFFATCLEGLKRVKDLAKENFNLRRMEAEVHCLLAFLAKETNETLETALAIAIEHLSVCRNLSHRQPWQFKPKVLIIKLKKPIAIHGLRFDDKEIYDYVDGCSMTIYMIATLLEHELLISLANEIMHSHHAPTEEDVKVAHEFADHALKLALEVRQPTAMASALVRFGLVLRHSGAHEDALHYFEHLQQHAISSSDFMTEAIAYHNIGLCLIGSHKALEALECFAKQQDLAIVYDVKDLQADAMYEMGHLLLQEGLLWEAEECYAIAYSNFRKLPHTHSHGQAAWSMLGIAAGHKLWGRFASLTRHNRISDWVTLLAWKTSRRALSSNNRPSYKPETIIKTYLPLAKKTKSQLQQVIDIIPDYEQVIDALELTSDSKREEWRKRKDAEAEEEEEMSEISPSEEDFERTELDASLSQLNSEFNLADLLPGYEKFATRRVSSSPMVDHGALLLQQMLDLQNAERLANQQSDDTSSEHSDSDDDSSLLDDDHLAEKWEDWSDAQRQSYFEKYFRASQFEEGRQSHFADGRPSKMEEARASHRPISHFLEVQAQRLGIRSDGSNIGGSFLKTGGQRPDGSMDINKLASQQPEDSVNNSKLKDEAGQRQVPTFVVERASEANINPNQNQEDQMPGKIDNQGTAQKQKGSGAELPKEGEIKKNILPPGQDGVAPASNAVNASQKNDVPGPAIGNQPQEQEGVAPASNAPQKNDVPDPAIGDQPQGQEGVAPASNAPQKNDVPGPAIGDQPQEQEGVAPASNAPQKNNVPGPAIGNQPQEQEGVAPASNAPQKNDVPDPAIGNQPQGQEGVAQKSTGSKINEPQPDMAQGTSGAANIDEPSPTAPISPENSQNRPSPDPKKL